MGVVLAGDDVQQVTLETGEGIYFGAEKLPSLMAYSDSEAKAHPFTAVSYPYVGVSRKWRFGGSRGGRARAETHRKRDEIDVRYGA